MHSEWSSVLSSDYLSPPSGEGEESREAGTQMQTSPGSLPSRGPSWQAPHQGSQLPIPAPDSVFSSSQRAHQVLDPQAMPTPSWRSCGPAAWRRECSRRSVSSRKLGDFPKHGRHSKAARLGAEHEAQGWDLEEQPGALGRGQWKPAFALPASLGVQPRGVNGPTVLVRAHRTPRNRTLQ